MAAHLTDTVRAPGNVVTSKREIISDANIVLDNNAQWSDWLPVLIPTSKDNWFANPAGSADTCWTHGRVEFG